MRCREPVADDLPDHPSQSRAVRFRRDQLLRGFGFRIHARPKGQEPVWELDGGLVAESMALLLTGEDDPGNHGGDEAV